ncbi:hypothetical protein LTR95_010272 [Oleoguttula sp. CCFEE 5521]
MVEIVTIILVSVSAALAAGLVILVPIELAQQVRQDRKKKKQAAKERGSTKTRYSATPVHQIPKILAWDSETASLFSNSSQFDAAAPSR